MMISFRLFILVLLLILLSIYSSSSTGAAVVSDLQGQPPHPHCDDAGLAAATMDGDVGSDQQPPLRAQLPDEETSTQIQKLTQDEEELRRLDHLIHNYQSILKAQQQEELRRLDHLSHNYPSILKAQEEFRAMQENISAALENVLRIAILADSQSWLFRTFFYCCIAFSLICIITTAEELYRIRRHLFLGLCATIILEVGVIRLLGADGDYSTQLSKVSLLREVSLAAAAVLILHAFVTHKRG